MNVIMHCRTCTSFFFFNDTATTEIYTLSLHDALPISLTIGKDVYKRIESTKPQALPAKWAGLIGEYGPEDRKSTRLNSSHSQISYAVFCLKKKKTKHTNIITTTVCSIPVISTTCTHYS